MESMVVQIVLIFVNVGIGVFIGIHIFVVKSFFREIHRRYESHDNRLKALENNAVAKEDWLRGSALTREHLERLSRKMDGMQGQSQASIEIASAIASALNRQRGES